MVNYNFTGLENNTNLLELFEVMNNASGEWLVLGIMITIFVVAFISMKAYETETALRTASFITAIIGVLFYSAEMISLDKAIIPAVLLMITIFYSIIIKDTT